MLIILPPCFHFPPQKKLLHCHPASCAGQPLLHLSQYPPKITGMHVHVKEWPKAERIQRWRIVVKRIKWNRENTDNFLLGAQHAQLAEANVKGGTLERSIRLSHHNDIDPSGECGGVKATVQLLHRHKHCLCQLAHNIHGLGLEGNKQTKKNKKWEQRGDVGWHMKQKVSEFSSCRSDPFPLFLHNVSQHSTTMSSIYSGC